MALTKEVKEEIVKKYARCEGDTGSQIGRASCRERV